MTADKKKKRRTRWAIQAEMGLHGSGSKDWVTLAAYKTEKQAEKALQNFVVADEDGDADDIRVVMETYRESIGGWLCDEYWGDEEDEDDE